MLVTFHSRRNTEENTRVLIEIEILRVACSVIPTLV
jgi:hypothetical protein